MRLDENRKIAWVVLAVCVLVSIFALGGGALARERNKVLKVFNDGKDASQSVRHSMDAYLDSAAENATTMAGEAEIYLGQSQLSDDVAAQAAVVARDENGLNARYEAYTKLKDGVEKLYNSLYNNVSEGEFKNFKLAYDDFWGYDDMLQRDDYHKLAKSYNELISGFPGGVVAGLFGQGALNTFGG